MHLTTLDLRGKGLRLETLLLKSKQKKSDATNGTTSSFSYKKLSILTELKGYSCLFPKKQLNWNIQQKEVKNIHNLTTERQT